MGGGAGVFSFLEEGGWSTNFIRGLIPYHQSQIKSLYDIEPTKIVSLETTVEIAQKEFRTLKAIFPNNECVAIIANSALAKVEEERAERTNISYIVIHSDKQLEALTLRHTHKNREKQERELEFVLRNIIKGREDCLPQKTIYTISDNEYNLWGKEPFTTQELPHNSIIFPGSFNPFHEGHLDAIKVVNAKTGKKVWLELSIVNISKPPLSYLSFVERKTALQKVIESHPDLIAGTVFTNRAKISEKHSLLSNDNRKLIDFVAGFDTIKRLNIEFATLNGELEDIWMQCCIFENKPTFYVLHRESSEQDVKLLHRDLVNRCIFLNHTQRCLEEISSTKIRTQNA